MPDNAFDAVIVGSGPNGLAAGITLAREGLRVLILEARESPGGGMRTAELTLPGFHHDVCSAVHPMAGMSPFLSTLPLAKSLRASLRSRYRTRRRWPLCCPGR